LETERRSWVFDIKQERELLKALSPDGIPVALQNKLAAVLLLDAAALPVFLKLHGPVKNQQTNRDCLVGRPLDCMLQCLEFESIYYL
jgi:hypothetical protein